MDLLLRFLAGGILVSLFALLGDVLKPKSFAGLFGAAPSVALATLSLTIAKEGKAFASLEAKSMIAGAVAFFVYTCLCARILAKRRLAAPVTTIGALPVWLIGALGLWVLFLR
ncbi:MAG TPA: DUF3147 family protein [Candidatus Acidoferrales bacterium]|nr:DUF3147 family protein [Candidatus Acidoferrales bacterium]